MVEVAKIRAVLFARDFRRVAVFYSRVLGMTHESGDDGHALLKHDDFELVVHQIPRHLAEGITISDPPVRRESGAVRLDHPVGDVANSRALAKSLGGAIDEFPPPWADADTNFYLGFDPEGNVFGVSQRSA